MARNYLKDRIGDEINVPMVSCGFNLKNLLKLIRAFFVSINSKPDFTVLRLDDKNQAGQFGYSVAYPIFQ